MTIITKTQLKKIIQETIKEQFNTNDNGTITNSPRNTQDVLKQKKLADNEARRTKVTPVQEQSDENNSEDSEAQFRELYLAGRAVEDLHLLFDDGDFDSDGRHANPDPHGSVAAAKEALLTISKFIKAFESRL